MPQLQNLAHQDAAASAAGSTPVDSLPSLAAHEKLPSFAEARAEFTRGYLAQVLQITGGNVSQAARLAKRNRTDFYKLLGRYLLLPGDFKIR